MLRFRWVIQNNLINETDIERIISACSDINVEIEQVQVIPFDNNLPEFTIDSAVNIYYGSTTFINSLYNKLDKQPGIFFDHEKFSMQNYIDHWSSYMLNSDAVVTTLGEFCKFDYPLDRLFFIRPDADDKSFNGTVMSFEKIKNWTSNIIHYDNSNLNDSTKIIASTPFNIKKEWRNYVVNGKVVESTLYQENFRIKKSNTDIPEDMIQFVEDRCKEYTPHEIFAMDIALCGDQYYIIECGCINSIGFYAADISMIVEAITTHLNHTLSKAIALVELDKLIEYFKQDGEIDPDVESRYNFYIRVKRMVEVGIFKDFSQFVLD